MHKALGPGLLESAYETCLCYELTLKKTSFTRQEALPIKYKDVQLEAGYRLDIVVEELVIVELKSVELIAPIHEAQVLTYLRLRKLWLGLLINFNVPTLKQGIKRLVNG